MTPTPQKLAALALAALIVTFGAAVPLSASAHDRSGMHAPRAYNHGHVDRHRRHADRRDHHQPRVYHRPNVRYDRFHRPYYWNQRPYVRYGNGWLPLGVFLRR